MLARSDHVACNYAAGSLGILFEDAFLLGRGRDRIDGDFASLSCTRARRRDETFDVRRQVSFRVTTTTNSQSALIVFEYDYDIFSGFSRHPTKRRDEKNTKKTDGGHHGTVHNPAGKSCTSVCCFFVIRLIAERSVSFYSCSRTYQKHSNGSQEHHDE